MPPQAHTKQVLFTTLITDLTLSRMIWMMFWALLCLMGNCNANYHMGYQMQKAQNTNPYFPELRHKEAKELLPNRVGYFCPLGQGCKDRLPQCERRDDRISKITQNKKCTSGAKALQIVWYPGIGNLGGEAHRLQNKNHIKIWNLFQDAYTDFKSKKEKWQKIQNKNSINILKKGRRMG